MRTNYIELTLLEVEEALSYISPNLPYIDWSKIGRALYTEFGDEARSVFEEWSATGDSYHKREFNSWWKNFRRTKRTSFGSFIYEAMQAGWTPKKDERTEEEKREAAAEYKKRRQVAEEKRRNSEEKQWAELKKEEKLFNSWPKQFAPTQYMLKKQMADIGKFADVRLGRDRYNNPCLIWPTYEKLFNQGRFCGFEHILDKHFKVGKKSINKVSSDNARTDLGFYTFGKLWDCGPKRVFVVGGFADAYSAHVATSEVVITPIGEGNIPNLINRLKLEYPDIQFICSPDNDKTGLEMVNRSGGHWSLPAHDGYDWSDTYINQGVAAVAEQLLNIQGFETIESSSRYLQTEIRNGLNLLASGMGTGKSTTVKNFIKKNKHMKTLIISHRVALAKSLKSDLSEDNNGQVTVHGDEVYVEFYQDLILKDTADGVDANIALRNADILVCSVDSLWRLGGSSWDVVFVDEFEQSLGQYYAKTIQFGENCLNYLNFVLKNSQTQILADAHLGDFTFDFCNYIGLHSGVYVKNSFQVAQGKKLFVYESKDHLMEEVMQQVLAKGKRYIYANSKEQVKTIATAIEQERERKHYDGTVLVVHADVAKTDEEVIKALEDINTIVPELDILIASPTLGTGFDIKSNAHQFDKTIGFLSSNVGTSEEGHQGLNRARDVNEFHVYLDPTERSEPTDPTYIQNKLIEEKSAETMKILSIDPDTGEFTSKNPLYEWLYCKVKAKQNLSRNRYKARFLELAEQDGYEIIPVLKNELTAKFGATVREEAKERNSRITLREIEQAPVHIGENFQTMMRNGEDFTAVEITKSKVNYELHLDAADDEQLANLLPLAKEVYDEFSIDGPNAHLNQCDAAMTLPRSNRDSVLTALTYKQTKKRFVDAIKKLSWVNVNEHTAKTLDMKDVQHAESRVSWRHLAIQRAHMIKLLQVAGINEELNCNGKQWSGEQLNSDLATWLKKKKTQDRLYKYSNITVTANTLQNPVQWLNNHLRSFGVPIVKTKKRVNGKAINVYSVNSEEWESVKILVNLRTQGIEESLQEVEMLDIEVITKQVSTFIEELKAKPFKSGYQVRYEKLDKQCALAGLIDLRDELAQVFLPLASDNKDLELTQYDPPSPLVISKKVGQGGSFDIPNTISDNDALTYFEGREEEPTFKFPENTTNTLSSEQRSVVDEIARIAVDKHKLPAIKVIKLMVEYGLESFTHSVEAWAGSIRQAIEEGA
ncbi:PriCT-2 domain-containing protein [Vibrio sp. S4M6]|uniref:plasmid replication protein, CyRepA1 family n=1 Tax=Vibrio sinus TaxID=2946865 RepID=UPI00202A1528|nr:plasmid replication protein, CyRepA1 family [Vibrio sinus]MCL9783637.1 PriCT-2 domain-containing protein [Vibrio sinus]